MYYNKKTEQNRTYVPKSVCVFIRVKGGVDLIRVVEQLTKKETNQLDLKMLTVALVGIEEYKKIVKEYKIKDTN